MNLENKELVRKLMLKTVERMESESIPEGELKYLEEVIDILNQMFS